jgi:nucleoside-diphosphate-sugar epimerase
MNIKIKILILGSNGFFGKNLKNLFKFKDEDNIQLLFAERADVDISDKVKLEKFFYNNKPDIVINCCGIVGSSELNKDNNQLYIFNDNITLNINILHCCIVYKVKKLIIFSSYRLLNDNSDIISYNEEDINDHFTFNPECNNVGYLLSKHVMDMQIKLFQKYYKTSVVCLILPNIFGSYDNFCINGRIIPSLLYKFKNAMDNNNNVYINCNNDNQVNLIYINDLVIIIKECCLNKDINGNIIIFNPNGIINLKQLTEFIKPLMNFKNDIIFNSLYKNVNTAMIIPDISKFNNFFPNFVFSDLESSINETINFFYSIYS